MPADSDPLHAQAVWRRLIERIADAETTHLTIQADQGPWQPLLAGVQMKVLHRRGRELSYLLRMAPGACVPAHRHPVDEECIVLEGTVRIGRLEVGAGGYHLAHAGALHASLTTVTGAMLFLRGAVPDPAQTLA